MARVLVTTKGFKPNFSILGGSLLSRSEMIKLQNDMLDKSLVFIEIVTNSSTSLSLSISQSHMQPQISGPLKNASVILQTVLSESAKSSGTKYENVWIQNLLSISGLYIEYEENTEKKPYTSDRTFRSNTLVQEDFNNSDPKLVNQIKVSSRITQGMARLIVLKTYGEGKGEL